MPPGARRRQMPATQGMHPRHSWPAVAAALPRVQLARMGGEHCSARAPQVGLRAASLPRMSPRAVASALRKRGEIVAAELRMQRHQREKQARIRLHNGLDRLDRPVREIARAPTTAPRAPRSRPRRSDRFAAPVCGRKRRGRARAVPPRPPARPRPACARKAARRISPTMVSASGYGLQPRACPSAARKAGSASTPWPRCRRAGSSKSCTVCSASRLACSSMN